jgi:phytoene desaturase
LKVKTGVGMGKSEKKAIVIGAGVSGLAMGIRLAKKGYSVQIWEQNAFVGGKLSEHWEQGYRFDAGPSLFTLPELLKEVLELADQSALMPELIRLDPICRYFWNDGTRFDAPANPESFAAQAAETFQVNEGAVRAQLNRSSEIYGISAPVFLYRSMHRFSTYLNRDFLKGILKIQRLDVFKTLHHVHEDRLKSPKLVQLFDRYATYNGSNPYKAPATLQAIPSLEYFKGAWFPKDGMIAISKALEQAAVRLGVQIILNRSATRIQHKKNQVCAVDWVGGTASAQVVVSAIDVQRFYPLLNPAVELPQRIKAAERSTSALVFNWGMKSKYPELDVHNIFFADNYRAEFESLSIPGNDISEDPTIYLFISSKHIPADAPQGGENWFTMVNAPGIGALTKSQIDHARLVIANKLSKILGKSVLNDVQAEWILQPADIARRTGSPDGALYGPSSNSTLSAFNRHSNASASIKGLYFTGGSVHPGGGIPLCLLSARIASDQIQAVQ